MEALTPLKYYSKLLIDSQGSDYEVLEYLIEKRIETSQRQRLRRPSISAGDLVKNGLSVD